MKLRIRGNSLRLRVTQTEVTSFAESGAIHDSIEFGADSQLTYRLVVDRLIKAPRVDFSDGVISVRIPRQMADDWLVPTEVSLRGEQPLGAGAQLAILVEKDFACLAPREGEDDTDAFPHPDAGAVA